MKYFMFSIFMILTCLSNVSAQPLERIIKSLPVFVRYASVKADDGVLTLGVFSDEQPQIEKSILEIFKNLKLWDHSEVIQSVGNKKINVIALNSDNIAEFKGQVIWVIDAKDSLEKIKKHSEIGIFTIGAQNSEFEDYLVTTIIWEDKSDDPKIERWRLIKFIANCEISPLRFSNKIAGKEYFLGKKCD